ncbi:IclR family transcriptional regulator [Mycolicibacterium septicum DSM 44393]|uniref:IclR family transcriptional regulator n=1 Tax=Mycolicibacterium septicum DSM 44393 TaxID=1341646 RepID=A0A7X6MLZ8_9MYCO|nr:IclR family transcriptional regulator [Mycolicibacterium septicum]NKZ10841.1 IclR family transcriptional regulator [Mycolicibacterium septicum DSM 44393]
MSSVSRVTSVLDALASTRRRLTVRDIEQMTGVPRSSVHRIIQELEDCRYVVPVPMGGYRLGPGLLKVSLSSQHQIVSPMRPMVTALSQAVNENVDLAVLSGADVVIVDQVANPQRLQAVTKVGATFSLHASCVGKALLSRLPEDHARDLLPRTLESFAHNTITDKKRLLAEVAEIRQTGIAFDHEEHDVGISAVATCLGHPSGVIQAIAIVAPTQRFARRRSQFVDALREAHTRSLATPPRAP